MGNTPQFRFGRRWLQAAVCAATIAAAAGAWGQAADDDTFPAITSADSQPPPAMPPAPAHAGAGKAPRAEAAAADAIEHETRAVEDAAEPRNGGAPSPAAAAEIPIGPDAKAATVDAAGTTEDAGTVGPAAAQSAGLAGDAAAGSSRLESLLEIRHLTDAKQYLEAVPVGQKLLAQTRKEFGDRSLETADAYVTLARVQRDAGQHDAAEKNYLQAIGLIRAVDGNFSERAIDPLIGLGDNYEAAGKYLDAVTAYNSARGVTRRVYGLLSPTQVPILDRLTASFLAMNKYKDADNQQIMILRLAQRNNPPGSPKYLEGVYRYAAWLRQSQRYDDERSEYSEAIHAIRAEHGKNSPLLIRPLREIANSFRAQTIPDNRGLQSLQAALAIAKAQPEANPLAEAEVLRDIGDWRVAFSSTNPDLSEYRQAWDLLGRVPNGNRLRQEWFSGAEVVLEQPIVFLGMGKTTDPSQTREGRVDLQFDVDKDGQTMNVSILRSDPPGFRDDAFKRIVQDQRYRPLFVDGEPARKDHVKRTFEFRYAPKTDKSDKSKDKSA